MAAVVTEDRKDDILEHLRWLLERRDASARRVRGELRLPWKKQERFRVIWEACLREIEIGSLQHAVGKTDEGRETFRRAITTYSALEGQQRTRHPGYRHLQLLSAGLVAGQLSSVEELARDLFANFAELGESTTLSPSDYRKELAIEHGSAALIGWFGNAPVEAIQAHVERCPSSEHTPEQFSILAAVANAGALGNRDALQRRLTELSAFVEAEIVHGDFRDSEDRYVYLPGMGIAIAARQRGLALELPRNPRWPAALLPK